MAMYLNRGLEPKLRQSLETAPLVILEGARAVGKTRLVDHAIEQGWLTTQRSFLQPAELDAARAAPRDYIFNQPHGTAIDEAQLCEAILLPVKERVESSEPGALLLTGSTRLRRDELGGSDPLAGRVGSPLQLGPMTLGERQGSPIQLVDQLFDSEPTSLAMGSQITRSDLIELVKQVGLPGFSAVSGADRLDRASAYLSDVTSLSNFESLDMRSVGQLARFLGGRTSTMVNISQFSQATELSRPSVEKYLARLEEALVVHRLRGWRRSKDKSETDRPKIHFFDTGVACAVARMKPGNESQDLGRLVESFVVTELIRQGRWLPVVPDYYHWRRNDREEVDLVVEDSLGRALCIEVKSSERVQAGDFSGIDAFRRAHTDVFHRGFVFYSGSTVLSFGDNRWALPISSLRPIPDPRPGPRSIEEIATAVSKTRSRLRSNAGSSLPAAYRDEAVRQLRALGQSIEGFEGEVKVVSDQVVLAVAIIQTPRRDPQRLLVIRPDLEKGRIEATVQQDIPGAWGYGPSVEPIDDRPPQRIVTAVIEGVIDDLGTELARRDQEHG